VDGELKGVLGAPVEPPEDVWAAALSAAVDDPRDAAGLAFLVPDTDQPSDGVAAAVALGEDTDDLLEPDAVLGEDFFGWYSHELDRPTELPQQSTDVDDAGSGP
jgi:hypothetical protein